MEFLYLTWPLMHEYLSVPPPKNNKNIWSAPFLLKLDPVLATTQLQPVT